MTVFIVFSLWYLIGVIGCTLVLFYGDDFQVIRVSNIIVSIFASLLGPITIIEFFLFSTKWKNVIIYRRKNVIIYRKPGRYSDN